MKEGWEIKKIKEICKKASSNVAQNTLEGNTGDFPIYGASGFIKNINFFQQSEPYIGIVKDGSGVGRVNIYPAFSSLLGTLQYILPKEGFDLKFILYALQSLNLSKYSCGAAIPHIYYKDYGEHKICVPSLSEQQRIVSKLDSVFEKIDALKANAENNLKNAKDLFQQVLKKELEPKEGWSEKRMIEIADLCLGKMLDKQKNKGIKQPYLRNVNVRWGSFDCSDILEMPFEKDEETRYSIIKNDIVMCEGGEPGRCAIWTSEKSIKFQKALHRIRCKKGTNPRFLYYTFLMYYNSGKLKKHYSGTTILHLTGEKLKEIFISLPSLSEQQRIVSILDSLSDKCKQLEENYSKTVAECDALKQAVLREVMSVE